MNAIEKLKSSPLDHLGQRVITLGMMDEVHGRIEGTAGRAFRKHREKLVEGRHYFTGRPSDVFRRVVGSPDGSGREPILLTERGYLVLVKSFHDDLAWQVQEELVDGYFRARSAPMSSDTQAYLQGLAELQGTVRALVHIVSDVLKVDRRRAAEAGRVMAGFKPRRSRPRKPRSVPVQVEIPTPGSSHP